MNTAINWKRGIFSRHYNLFQQGKKVGSLKSKSLGQSALGELNGKMYGFNTYGIFRKRTEILDGEDGRVLGEISFNCLGTSADIVLEGKAYKWKFGNLFQTRWKIRDESGNEILYKGWTAKGRLFSTSDEEIELLQLSGLFIANYLWEGSVIAAMPIWILPILLV